MVLPIELKRLGVAIVTWGVLQVTALLMGDGIDHALAFVLLLVLMAFNALLVFTNTLDNRPKWLHAPRFGYVYLLSDLDGTYYKIGRTSKPIQRIRSFEVRIPYNVEYDTIIPTADMFKLEHALHRKFASKRVDGEWFALSDDDLNYIRQLAQKG